MNNSSIAAKRRVGWEGRGEMGGEGEGRTKEKGKKE